MGRARPEGQGGPERGWGEGGRHVPQGVGHAVVVMDKAAAEQQTENDHRRGLAPPNRAVRRSLNTTANPTQAASGQQGRACAHPGGLAEQALDWGTFIVHRGHGSTFHGRGVRRRPAWVISSISR